MKIVLMSLFVLGLYQVLAAMDHDDMDNRDNRDNSDEYEMSYTLNWKQKDLYLRLVDDWKQYLEKNNLTNITEVLFDWRHSFSNKGMLNANYGSFFFSNADLPSITSKRTYGIA